MFATFAALITLQATAAAPSYWGELKPGPHPVGFTQSWVIDSTRRLLAHEKYGLRYRPVLLNIWYPATASKRPVMVYDDYFEGAIRSAGNGKLRGYAAALIDYQRNTAWRELARVERDSTAPALAHRIEQLFRTSTFVQRDAPRARPSGRVVVYTSGSGSSMDDNVVLCEYLASLGYTVIGSAYPAEDSSFATTVADRSRPRDIARLLMELPRRGFPVTHVTAVGHSAGAQALLWYAADPSVPLDAILSLDTTQDYAMLSDDSWAYYTREVIRERRGVRLPILFVADRTALFELADSLAWTRRTLLTLTGLDHNDFISQGNIRKQLLIGLPDADSSERVMAARVYAALNQYVGSWIRSLEDSLAFVPSASELLTVQPLPVGEKSPVIGPDPIRSAREIRHLFSTVNASQFADRAMIARKANEEVAGNQVLMMLLVDAIRQQRQEQARNTYRELTARDTTVRKIAETMERRAKLFESIGAKDIAADWRSLRQALVE